MIKSLLSIPFLFLTTTLFAQEIKYTSPNAIENSKATITLESIKSTSGYVYAKIQGKNKSDGYLYCNLKASSFKTTKQGTSSPTFGKILVPPNSQRSANVKAKIGENVDEFKFLMKGASYAESSNDYLTATPLSIDHGKEISVGNFTIKVINWNTKNKKKNTARLDVRYNGPNDKVGVIDFKAIKAEGLELKMVKGKVGLMKGQSAKAYITIKSKEAVVSFTFPKALQELTLKPIQFEEVNIQKEGYQPKSSPVHAVNGSYKPFIENTSSPLKVTFFNTENEGFKVFSDGAERTSFYTTNALLGMNSGAHNIQVMVDGIASAVINTTIEFPANVSLAKYQIKREASGTYSILFVEIPVNKTAPTTTVTTNTSNTVTSCELSFSDFTSLKKDIKTEANAGGNPVGLATETIFTKKCISTAQVVDMLDAFNLDNNRLDFAKKAYKYTSDKNKYFQVVQQLSYAKNKEALENYISTQ